MAINVNKRQKEETAAEGSNPAQLPSPPATPQNHPRSIPADRAAMWLFSKTTSHSAVEEIQSLFLFNIHMEQSYINTKF